MLVLLYLIISLRQITVQKFDSVVTIEDQYYLPPPSWMKLFSIGYNEAMADTIWGTALVYFGGKKTYYERKKDGTIIQPETATYTINHLDIVTKLDPKFKAAYIHGGTLTMFHRGTISKQTINMAIKLLNTGLLNFPNDGAIAFNLGFYYYNELPVYLSKEEQPKAKKIGARLIRRSALMEGAPSFASLFAGSIMEKEGLDDMVIEHLKTMLVKETNPNIRRRLHSQLMRKLNTSQQRDVANISSLYDDWSASHTFVPFDLFLITRPRVKEIPSYIISPLYTADLYLELVEPEISSEPMPKNGIN